MDTTRAYEPEANHHHYANKELRANIINRLRTRNHKVWEGPTVTHQAMMAETWEDVQSWSQDGFYGVEMEAATVFAVSNYFRIPSAAILMIADNLIKQHTVLDMNYKETRQLRQKVICSMFDTALDELLSVRDNIAN